MRRKVIKYLVIPAIVFGIGFGGYSGYKTYSTTNAVTATSYNKAAVKRGNIEVNISASGTVTSASTKDIYAVGNGLTLESLNVKEGDAVKKGDIIGKVDNSSAEQDVAKAQNTLSSQYLALENLKRSLNNYTIKSPISGTIKTVNITQGDDISTMNKIYQNQGLIVITDSNGKDVQVPVSSGVVSKVYATVGSYVDKGSVLLKLDDSDMQNNIKAKNNDIMQAQNDLNNKKENLAKTTLISPIDGIVGAINYAIGDTIQSSKAVATVVDNSQMQTVVPVDELDIQKVKLGQVVQVSVDAITGKTFEGTVAKIATIGTTSNGVTTYNVTVNINKSEEIKIGMTTNVKIKVESKENVLMVPVESIVSRGSSKYVLISSESEQDKSNNKNSSVSENTTKENKRNASYSASIATIDGAAQVKVETGISNDSYTEIISGVKEGEDILIPVYNSTATSSQNQSTFGMSSKLTGGMGNSNRPSGNSSTSSKNNK